jgi:hypothetical protein
MRRLVLIALTAFAGLSACTYECNATNCADGCCGANGVCYAGGSDGGGSDTYCGLGGAACQDCAAQQQTCNAGTCGVACVMGAHCEKSSDCCSTQICWNPNPELGNGECTHCRAGGDSCVYNEDCCGYPGLRCDRPDGVNFICR